MRTKDKMLIVAIGFLVLALSQFGIAKAGPQDHELPSEDDLFWRVTSSMDTPTDTLNCQNAINSMAVADLVAYAAAHPHADDPHAGEPVDENVTAEEIRANFSTMCEMIAQMPTQMETEMTAEGVSTNLFSQADWHNISGLYFQNAGRGRISFSNTLDFLSYRFMRFMNNFGSMVVMNNGYVSINAAMLDDIKNYGATITMYGLNLGSTTPDIYVNGRLATTGDVSGISYDASAGTLSFSASHFSAYKAVAHGTKVKTMSIRKVNPKSIKYNAHKRTFKIVARGRNFVKNANAGCMLGFESASKVRVSKRKVSCTFPMSYFADKGTFGLTISIPGTGEVTKANAVRIR